MLQDRIAMFISERESYNDHNLLFYLYYLQT